MAVINLYRSASAYTAVHLVELGAIDEWENSGTQDNNLSGIVGGLNVAKWIRSGPIISTNALNAIDFSQASSVALYANSQLNMAIRLYNLHSSKYCTVHSTNYDANVIYSQFSVDRPGEPYINNVYLARATIGNQVYIGFYVYNLRESVGQVGQAGFYTNSSWSQAFLQEAHFINTDNPYYGGGYSEPGGGDSSKQNWADTSDFVNPDTMPDETAIGAVDSGLLTIFTPSKAQLNHLSSLLWANDFFSFVEKSLTGIEDLFVSLGIVPFVVTAGGLADVTWLNYSTLGPAQIPTSVQLTKAASQFMEFNMGNVSLTGNDDRVFATDSVLDYSPYSRLGIYLPFIGYQELDIDECREKTINLKYRIDILSGACVALISINGRTMYQFSGNCITQIPLTSADYSQAINTAVNVGIAATSMGTTAAVASAGDALTASKAGTRGFTKEMGEYQNVQHAAMVSNAENSLAGATANGFMGMKPNFKKSGAISGSTSLLSVKQPYLCITTPRQSMPEGYERVCGFPCNVGGKLSDFSGYTVVEDVRLNGLVATSPEVEEIYQLLKTGIII